MLYGSGSFPTRQSLEVNMSSFISFIVTVTIAFTLLARSQQQEWLYLRDCDDVCPRNPDAICQLRCREIINGEGNDCVNQFYDANNKRIFCFF